MIRFIAVVGLALIAVSVYSAEETPLQIALMDLLNNDPAAQLDIHGRRLPANDISRELLSKYSEQSSGFSPLWVSDQGPGERARVALEILSNADREGLNSADYKVEQIRALWSGHDVQKLARLEVLLSYAVAAYAADAREGRADPAKLDPGLFASARDVRIDPVELAVAAVNAPDLTDFMNRQAPASLQYKRLREVLPRYREFEREGGWQPVEGGETLRAGMRSPRLVAVRERLRVSGDLNTNSDDPGIYDQALETAVRRFQTRFHLDVDGAIGKRTVAAMNISAAELVQRIIINMERWRWLNADLGNKRLLVNIAGFELAGAEEENVQIRMPVIVGREYHKTPVFSGNIRYMEINPYWNIPVSIAQKEMYPKLLKNPYYLRGRQIRVFAGWGPNAPEIDSASIDWHRVGSRGMRRFRLRQDPGNRNSLGRIKFMFPNQYDVYLHDTPTHSLFKRSRRAFSHGCIRVSRPLQLASYLLGGDDRGWPVSRIRKIVDSGKRKVIKLDDPLPVHLIYRTASVDEDGVVYFSDDVYGRDKLLAKALF